MRVSIVVRYQPCDPPNAAIGAVIPPGLFWHGSVARKLQTTFNNNNNNNTNNTRKAEQHTREWRQTTHSCTNSSYDAYDVPHRHRAVLVVVVVATADDLWRAPVRFCIFVCAAFACVCVYAVFVCSRGGKLLQRSNALVRCTFLCRMCSTSSTTQNQSVCVCSMYKVNIFTYIRYTHHSVYISDDERTKVPLARTHVQALAFTISLQPPPAPFPHHLPTPSLLSAAHASAAHMHSC